MVILTNKVNSKLIDLINAYHYANLELSIHPATFSFIKYHKNYALIKLIDLELTLVDNNYIKRNVSILQQILNLEKIKLSQEIGATFSSTLHILTFFNFSLQFISSLSIFSIRQIFAKIDY